MSMIVTEEQVRGARTPRQLEALAADANIAIPANLRELEAMREYVLRELAEPALPPPDPWNLSEDHPTAQQILRALMAMAPKHTQAQLIAAARALGIHERDLGTMMLGDSYVDVEQPRRNGLWKMLTARRVPAAKRARNRAERD